MGSRNEHKIWGCGTSRQNVGDIAEKELLLGFEGGNELLNIHPFARKTRVHWAVVIAIADVEMLKSQGFSSILREFGFEKSQQQSL